MHIITGGAGFIGSALVWQLNQLGVDDILIVDNLGSSQKWRNLVKARYVDYLHKDKFLAIAQSGKMPWKVDTLVHLGASSATTETDADYLMSNNFHYSQEMCRFALRGGARFINASSAATYGDGSAGFDEDIAKLGGLRPLNMYGYSKHLFDMWLMRENLLHHVASLKFFNVYGPNEYHKGAMQSVAAKFYEEISRTGTANLFESNTTAIAHGEQKRDFVYIKDCARLVAWLALERPGINGIHNVGSGKPSTFNELAAAVFNTMEKPVNIAYKPMPASIARNYQNYTCAKMDWLETAEYPYAFRGLEDGIKEYTLNYLAAADPYL